ncbi:MAG: leucine-rich repeat protein, partial [Treponemataceae bacterium]
EIPNRVTSIADGAFQGSALTELTFELGNDTKPLSIGKSAFYAQRLSSVIIPKRTSSIDKNAFLNNSNLKKVYIDSQTIANLTDNDSHLFTAAETVYVKQGITPSSESYIIENFSNEGELTNGYVPYTSPESLEYELINNGTEYRVIGKGDVTGTDIIIPATYEGLPVTEVGEEAFKNKGITSVHIGKNIKTIGNYAFYADSDSGTLKILMFEKGSNTQGLTIGDYAFSYQKIEVLEIPSRTTEIGNYAFDAGSGRNATLTTLTFEKGSSTHELIIGERAFRYQKIEELEIPNRTTKIGSSAFYADSGKGTLRTLTFEKGSSTHELIIGENAFRYQKIEELEIPNRTTEIRKYAFYGDSRGGTLRTLTFENGDTLKLSIGLSGFEYQLLEKVVFPRRLTKIDSWAFRNNTQLAKVFIPKSVTAIDGFVFIGIKEAPNTIVTEHESRPKDWHSYWNNRVANVKWKGTIADVQ